MVNNQDRPQVWRSYGTGTGGYRRLEPMNERELAAREALQQPYNAMLARQQAYEAKLQPASEPNPAPVVGCVFAKSCNLPDTIISYNNPSGYIPLERLADYGEHAVLGLVARLVGIDPQTKIDCTTDELYHGHVRSWEELHQDMKNALIKAGKTNRKGKTLGAEK